MRHWILATLVILLATNGDARERWGPPPACPQPKVDCCPKKKPCAKPCPKPCSKPKECNPCKPKPICKPKECNPCKPFAPICKPKECNPCKPFAPICKPKECNPCKPFAPICKPKECNPCKPAQAICKPKPNPVCSKPKSDPCKPYCPERCLVLEPAYNKCAAIDLDCGWNVWVDGSFTYWQAMEDNTEVAVSVPPSAGPLGGTNNADIIDTDYGYKPGFKVGLGITSNYDCWDFFAEYTWFRSTVSQNFTAPEGGSLIPVMANNAGADTPFLDGSSTWRVTLDLLDGRMGRWYHVGKHLTFHPYFGVRAGWISQDLDSAFSVDQLTINQEIESWGIGPQVGIDTHWKFCYGFRLYGQAEVDVLFTRYTRVKTFEEHLQLQRITDVTQTDNNTLRTHIDLELGIGWGTYLDCYKWYFDLAAGYNFQTFFDQNMFRQFYEQIGGGFSSVAGGNLYLHGLNITARIEF